MKQREVRCILIFINNCLDMSFSIGHIFSKIPADELDLAINCGLLLGAAASIFYLFFGRLFSLPELLAISLKTPTSPSSRNSIIVFSGFVFLSALIRTLYHEHLTAYYPFDNEVYLKKISTLRLIISGILVGLGSQIALNGRENTGVIGVPTFSLDTLASFFAFLGSTMLAVTYKWAEYIPKTPRVIEIANQALPKNISFDSYMLVTLLIPFVCFLISEKKSLKGMIESLLHFIIGIMVGGFVMMLGWSSIQQTFQMFSYSKKWTGEMLVAFAIASVFFSFIFLIVKYGFKKPLFSNELKDKRAKLSFKSLLGHILIGVGFGLGGLTFQSFLLTVPSSEIRMVIFWGIPCVFAMKAVQVISQTSELPAPQKKQ